jgi:phosphatidylinositol 4-kinase
MLLTEHQYLLVWASVTPIVAVTYFQQDEQDPLVLQYAHRVLEQHPVDLTFFFIPQIVQALRYDKLGGLA